VGRRGGGGADRGGGGVDQPGEAGLSSLVAGGVAGAHLEGVRPVAQAGVAHRRGAGGEGAAVQAAGEGEAGRVIRVGGVEGEARGGRVGRVGRVAVDGRCRGGRVRDRLVYRAARRAATTSPDDVCGAVGAGGGGQVLAKIRKVGGGLPGGVGARLVRVHRSPD